MAIITQSTPFPVPTFSVSEIDASLDQFLDFLRALVSQYLSDTAPRIPSSSKVAWVEVVLGQSQEVLLKVSLISLLRYNFTENLNRIL